MQFGGAKWHDYDIGVAGILPGGITCDRQTAEAAAKKIHDLQAKKARN